MLAPGLIASGLDILPVVSTADGAEGIGVGAVIVCVPVDVVVFFGGAADVIAANVIPGREGM